MAIDPTNTRQFDAEFIEHIAAEAGIDPEIVAKVWETIVDNSLRLYCHDESDGHYSDFNDLVGDMTAYDDPSSISFLVEYKREWI